MTNLFLYIKVAARQYIIVEAENLLRKA